jgi:putative copper resistance protein D
MDLGKAAVARGLLAVMALALLAMCRSSRGLWIAAALVGGAATATFAWMGHGVATEGDGHLLHLVADIVHSLVAALWIGALCAFLLLLTARLEDRQALLILHGALKQFSIVGTLLVLALVGSGLINSWFLIGLDLQSAILTKYGQLLALKLLLFGGMLILAAVHRFRLVPALGRQFGNGVAPDVTTLSTLRRTVSIEAALGFGVMAAVAWLGTLPPPTMQ